MINVAKAFLFIVFACFVEVLVTIVRARLGFTYSVLIGFVVFFLVAYYSFRLTKNLSPRIIVLLLFLGVSALLLPPRLMDFHGTLVSFPDYVFHSLGLFTAYCFYIARAPGKWIAVGFSFALTCFMFFKGYSMWLHKLNFDTYTGSYFTRLPEFSAEDAEGNIVTKSSFADKIVFIDIWHTRCGACFRKFPTLNKLYLKHKDNEEVRFIAMNYPLETDRPSQAYDIINKRGYSFPVAKLKTIEFLDSLRVSVFPTTILVDRHGNVVFKGSLDNGIKFLERSIKNEGR